MATEVEAAEGVMVFDADGALSRAFLLARGYCCENGCRNCPYGEDVPVPPQDTRTAWIGAGDPPDR